jgi:hypothetical protein
MRTGIAVLMLRSVLAYGVLCVVAQGRDSKWELVNTREASDAEGNEYFVDTANLRFTEDPVTASVLMQYRDIQTHEGSGYEYRSSTRLSAFDCAHRRSALMAMTVHSGDRGTGHVVRTVDTGIGGNLTWVDVTPASVDEAILKFVCSRAPVKSGARGTDGPPPSGWSRPTNPNSAFDPISNGVRKIWGKCELRFGDRCRVSVQADFLGNSIDGFSS